MSIDLKRMSEKADSVVVKRLKFVFKIIKAISAQPNTRNRQAHAYILEVLDCIGDWSGNYNPDLVDLLEDEIFPQICVLISTFNRDEFTVFQTFIGKYLVSRWKETFNFAVLDFVADLYGFITRIAPICVVEEYIEVFSQEKMSAHVQMMILPSILRNLTEEASSKLNDRLSTLPISTSFLNIPGNSNITDQQRSSIKQFWSSLADILHPAINVRKAISVINQCIITSYFLKLFPEADLLVIVQDLLDWGSVVKILDFFLIISTIFISNILPVVNDQSIPTLNVAMKNLMILVGKNSKLSPNKCHSAFVIQIIQRLLEHRDDFSEVVEEFKTLFELQHHEISPSASQDDQVLMNLENCVKRVLSSDSAFCESEHNRKRLKLIIDDLSKALVDEEMDPR